MSSYWISHVSSSCWNPAALCFFFFSNHFVIGVFDFLSANACETLLRHVCQFELTTLLFSKSSKLERDVVVYLLVSATMCGSFKSSLLLAAAKRTSETADYPYTVNGTTPWERRERATCLMRHLRHLATDSLNDVILALTAHEPWNDYIHREIN